MNTLYLRERHVKAKTSRWERLTPRTVRDCIPNSKLAQYSNYEYDEARELSYSPMVIKFERLYETFDQEDIREPWMLEEIDDLFIGFLSYNYFLEDCQEGMGNCSENHENLPCSKDFCEMSCESPFLEAHNFEEMALKLSIVSENIKKVWDIKYFPYYGWHPVTKAKNLILFKSPACQMFPSIKDEMEDSDWLKNVPDAEGTFSQIKILTQSFKEQNTWIFKKQNSSRSWLDPNHDPVDLSNHRRLYSAVLQGPTQDHLPPERDTIALQFPSTKSRAFTSKIEIATETSDINSSVSFRYPSLACSATGYTSTEQGVQINRGMTDVNSLGYNCSAAAHQSYSYYNSRNTVQTTPSTSTPIPSVFATPTNYTNYQYLPQSNNYFNPRLYSNNFIPNASVLNFRQTSYFPLVLQNATAPYAQSSFYNYHRGAFPNYARTMVIPPRPQVVVPNSGWLLQQPVKIGQPTINLLAPRPPIHAPSYQYRAPCALKPRLSKPPSIGSSGLTTMFPTAPKEESINQDLENIVAKTVNAVLDDPDPYVPVTGTPSDELELQALEQYSPSNDSVFQELERQAAEQYETSENWRSPPICDDNVFIFGGFLRFRLVRFRCVVEFLRLGRSGTFKTEIPNLILGCNKS